MLWETKNRVKVRRKLGVKFLDGEEIRQRCFLFNILMTDQRKKWEKLSGGMKLRDKNMVWLMQMILLAEDERGHEEYDRKVRGYIERKGLELNRKRTKIMRFRKREGKSNKMDWRWKDNGDRRGKDVQISGIYVAKERRQEEHVKKRVAKRAAMMGQRDSAREGYEKEGYGYLTH